MKKYVIEEKIYRKLPNPLKTNKGTFSPVTDHLFRDLGGEIIDDGEMMPEERIYMAFADLIEDLSKKTDAITPREFLAAAQSGISSDLILFARSRGVPEEVIEEGRKRIIEIMADATRFGVEWADLVSGAMEA